MTLSISVPALQQILGPFSLTLGVVKTWPVCLYPMKRALALAMSNRDHR